MAADFMSLERLNGLYRKLVKLHKLQTDILELKRRGKTNRYIAGKLGIPESTVMTFLKNLEEEDEKFI